MTGYTVHTGSSEKFSSGWDNIFGKGKTGKKSAAARKPASTKAKTGSSKKKRK